MVKDQAYFYLLGPQTMVAAGDEALSGPGVKVGYLSLEKLKAISPTLGIADKLDRDFAQEPARLRNSIDVYADASIGIINIINMADMDAQQDRIAFVVKKDLFLLAEIEDADGSVLRLFEGAVQRLQGGGTLERFIYAVLERLLSGSNRMLEDMEQRILKIERDLLGDDADRQLSRVIYACRQRLSLAYNYLEQLIDIAQELEENENELFDRENLWHLGLFIGKAERISASVQMMGESAVHLRESLDAVINYNLNRIMKILTVITAIFMPLTLIVGWYGMNFEHMPELSQPMAYPALGLVFVVVILVIVYVFKRKKFM
ncbi:CorA family divalent cation transporter [Spirochaetota bacterium]